MTRRKSKSKIKSNDNYSPELRLITEAAKHQKSKDAFSNPLSQNGGKYSKLTRLN